MAELSLPGLTHRLSHPLPNAWGEEEVRAQGSTSAGGGGWVFPVSPAHSGGGSDSGKPQARPSLPWKREAAVSVTRSLVHGASRGSVALEAGRLGSGQSLSLTRSVTLGVSLNLSAPYFPIMQSVPLKSPSTSTVMLALRG